MLAIYGEGKVEGDAEIGPWSLTLLDGCMLEVHLPCDYPSRSAPTPVLHAPVLASSISTNLATQLLEMYDGGECVFQWVEHLNEQLRELLAPEIMPGAPLLLDPLTSALC